jgi:drug/metabolite transporter (DMT)-like permease
MSVTGFSTGELSIGMGEILSLVSAIFYACAMISLDLFTEKSSPGFLTGSQFIFTFLVAAVFAVIIEQPPVVEMNGIIIAEFVYLIFLGTFLTQLLFTFGIKYASATQAGVIFPLESVSATALGCLFLGEVLEGVHIIGGILLVIAIVISSLEPKSKEEKLKA